MITLMKPNHPGWPKDFPEQLTPFRTEFETYYRQLPELLAAGELGRYAIVKGTKFCGVWDTYRDARQHGGEVFGMEQFLVQVIDPQFLEIFERWFGALPQDEEAA